LRQRKHELERATLARVGAISDPTEVSDPAYAEGLRQAVSTAIDYAIEKVEVGEEPLAGAPPAILLEQARLAAQSGIGLDTVLRRYFAGFTLFSELLLQEANSSEIEGPSLHQLTQTTSGTFDRLVKAVSEEYTRHREAWIRSSGRRQAERVERLLSGELVDTFQLDYELDAWHIGLLVEGEGAERVARRLARDQAGQILLVPAGEQRFWAWLGFRSRPEPKRLAGMGCGPQPPQVALAVGEPGQGFAGWRLTHRQAMAAMPLAMHRPGETIRYSEVTFLAALLTDDLLAESLRQMFLVPLASERDDGQLLIETLRAYVAAQGNVSSAAAALEVSRHTVTNRLRRSERLLGRPIGTCLAELAAALRLTELDKLLVGAGHIGQHGSHQTLGR